MFVASKLSLYVSERLTTSAETVCLSIFADSTSSNVDIKHQSVPTSIHSFPSICTMSSDKQTNRTIEATVLIFSREENAAAFQSLALPPGTAWWRSAAQCLFEEEKWRTSEPLARRFMRVSMRTVKIKCPSIEIII